MRERTLMSDLDEKVVEEARAGDTQAFEEVVRHYDPGLRVLAVRLVGETVTDDVLQESYIKAFRGIDGFRAPNGAVGAWLARIVYRTCLDEIRSMRRRTSQPLDQFVDRLATDSGPDESVIEREQLAAALASLSEEHRAAVVLVDALGFDYASAAGILGIRRGTLASRLNHSRAALRRVLLSDPVLGHDQSRQEGE